MSSVEDEIPIPSARIEEYESSLFEQEFTEEDVLPFLLQAQDIISKLESRVVELEKDLSTIHCKYEHDKNEWLIGLSQKDQYINHLTSKLSKIEFNSKETIILLSDLNINDEEQVKSAVNLSLQYLRQAQTIKQEEPDDLEEGELERRQAAVVEWSSRTQDIPDNSMSHNEEEPLNLMDGLSSSSTGSAHVTYNTKSIYNHPHVVDEEESQFCMNCKQLLAQLDEQIEQKAYLKRDLGSLAAALSEQEEIRSNIEQDKEALEEDVAGITLQLFSALNQILMEEVTERDHIVQLNREFTNKFTHLLDNWDVRDSKLKEMKELLIQLDSAVHQSVSTSATFTRRFSQQNAAPMLTTTTTTTTTAATAMSGNSSMQKRLSSHRRTPSFQQQIHNTIQIDGYALSEFQQHLKALTSSNQPIPSTSFVKRVFSEDIEPCLFSQQSNNNWWKSTWFKKKLLDAISKNKCEIQYWNGTYSTTSYMSATTTSSSSVTSSASHVSSGSNNVPMPPKTKCVSCNVLRVCEFRLRLPPASNPWLPIDRFCRDKIIAVCGYYSFMNNLKSLSTSSTLLNTFKQVMYHRRRMTLSRVGSISLFEDLEDLDDNRRHSRRYRGNRESVVLDHSGSNSDSGSVVSVSDLQGLEGTTASQIVIVH
ncbi:uncharacterized protein RHIMIDRAFT_233375 [Rhizopus microsporus ATCC 52813]|uniref:GDP/GTP exchange factor Sec2 N-terminal domain-containing protein n=1 Tax=Rhizopus microsporus ATCC 52813 TaxID=1340429 RepID=A0A2G4TAA7_RHIZD|nr:uncharacterized protein RHIMIDRAFT_233375 [Rhizopus microsporus ATCC 52813]PHZ17954.1 hypothetical protein RHIMIDRAFT_233375 [Rhizopus microsporus ATCC 52813]